ncbi:SPW repeat protein [Streptomyces sp. NPDC026673]|uniref:SPW repeat protein n=1 Tax=Streptomyces sp. NPDC026673 TaxID=3155724 RepID=UPI0033D10A21
MADLSHRPGDLSGHPDVHEMGARYARMLEGGRDVALVDGPVFLSGLYCAISPWTVHFSGARPELALNNLVIGIAVALLGLCLAMAPARMYGLSWAIAALGIWMIISPWVVSTTSPGTGAIVNNVVVGAVICLLGLVAAATLGRTQRGTTTM